MSRPFPPLASVLVLAVLAPGCARLVPTGAVLESMGPGDVDTVIVKAAGRYPQLGRLSEGQAFVFALDSVIVGDSLDDPEEKALIGTFASYMLGEVVGRQWVSRVEDQLAVFGQGQAILSVYRGEGERFLADILGTVQLYLPVLGSPGRTEGIEAVSFEIRAVNQPIAIAVNGGATHIYCELLPRSAVYTRAGPVFKRWEAALFHLNWENAANNGGGGGAARTPAGRDAAKARAAAEFVKNARAFVGPLVRLELHVAANPDGTSAIALGTPNAIELVLPSALIAGDAARERAADRLAAKHPGAFARSGDDLLIRVGYFFFHDDATRPAALDPAARAAAAALKRFRLPPE